MREKPDAVVPADPSADVRTSSNEVVEAWFLDYFHNVPNLSTEHFNKFRAAADDLKARLRAKEL